MYHSLIMADDETYQAAFDINSRFDRIISIYCANKLQENEVNRIGLAWDEIQATAGPRWTVLFPKYRFLSKGMRHNYNYFISDIFRDGRGVRRSKLPCFIFLNETFDGRSIVLELPADDNKLFELIEKISDIIERSSIIVGTRGLQRLILL